MKALNMENEDQVIGDLMQDLDREDSNVADVEVEGPILLRRNVKPPLSAPKIRCVPTQGPQKRPRPASQHPKSSKGTPKKGSMRDESMLPNKNSSTQK
jgi:hypothetical protein